MKLALTPAYRIAIAIAVVVGLMLSSIGNTVSHLPNQNAASEQTRHAELAMELEDHGHSHDDGEVFEQQAHHSHDHNPADHSHEMPHLTPLAHSLTTMLVQNLAAHIPQFIEPEAIHGLERPPKSISLI